MVDLEAKLAHARQRLQETRGEISNAGSEVDAALADLLTKQREAAAENSENWQMQMGGHKRWRRRRRMGNRKQEREEDQEGQ